MKSIIFVFVVLFSTWVFAATDQPKSGCESSACCVAKEGVPDCCGSGCSMMGEEAKDSHASCCHEGSSCCSDESKCCHEGHERKSCHPEKKEGNTTEHHHS